MKVKTLDIMAIPLTQGLFALVDGKNYQRLNKHKWYADQQNNTFYAARKKHNSTTKKTKLIYMHRDILGLPQYGKKIVDHKNHCGLDNRETNIRGCTYQQNGQNRRPGIRNKSGYKGVSQCKYGKMWVAQIKYKGKVIRIGQFDNKIIAAEAYDKRAKRLFGEFALTNF